MEFDLLTLRPMQVSEATPRDDLRRVILGLRGSPGWVGEGAPRSTIIDDIDDQFIHHREHYGRLIGAGARGIAAVRMLVGEGTCDITVDGSREWTQRAHSYSARIQFQNYPRIAALEKLSWPDKARALLEDNVRVDCTCKAFQYYYRHTATSKGFALVPESQPSPITNPHGRGSVCKHLEHALRYLGANYAVIASAMKLTAQESPMPSLIDRMNESLGESEGPEPVNPDVFHDPSTLDLDDGKAQLGHHSHMSKEHAASAIRLNTARQSLPWEIRNTPGIEQAFNSAIGDHMAMRDRHRNHMNVIANHFGLPIGRPESVVSFGKPTVAESGLTNPASGGILPEIMRLAEQARSKGMARTANALFMAQGMAGIEGASK